MSECEPLWDPARESEPGPELMLWCSHISAHRGSAAPGDLVDAMVACGRLEAWAAGGQAAVIAAFYDEALERHRAATAAEIASGGRPQLDDEDVDLEVTTEVGLALGLSPRAAGQLVWFARDLMEHPALLAALTTGRVDRRQAEVILTEVRVLPALADRTEVIGRLVGPDPAAPEGSDTQELVRELRRPGTSIWQLTTGRLRAITAREVLEVDTEAARRAAIEARQQRRVWERPVEHSMGELTVRAGAEQTGACWRSVDAAARSARASGDVRTLDQLRADIAVGRLTLDACGEPPACPTGDERTLAGESSATGRSGGTGSRAPAGPWLLTNLTMAAETYLGLDDRPAILHSETAGPTPLPAHIARALAHDPDQSFLRRVLTAPATGVAWDVSRRYRMPRSMAEFVKVRDGHRSRLPISGASRVEGDHVTPFDHDRPASGGRTTAANLQSLGHRDHRLKTLGRLGISGNANGVLEIRTSAGRTYLSYPEAYRDPDWG